MAITAFPLGSEAIAALPKAPGDEWWEVVDDLAEAVVAADAHGTFSFVNRAAERLLGRKRQELLGQPLTEVIPERFRKRHLDGFHRYLATGTGGLFGKPVRLPALRGDGTEVPVELLLSDLEVGGARALVGFLRDVSERVELEGHGDLADRLVATLAAAETLQDAWVGVLRALVESLRWDLAHLWLPDETDQVLRRHATWAAPGSDYAGFVEASDGTFSRGAGLPGRVWESSTPVPMHNLAAETDFPRARAAARVGFRSAFAFPVLAGNRAHGVIEMFSAEPREVDAVLSRRLAQLGRDLGWFLERRTREEERLALIDSERAARAEAEAAQRRLQLALDDAASLAATLQQSLLPPHLPDMPGIQIAARYIPARGGTDVGGDFYDVFRLAKDTWGVVIGDVCGKGASAATVTALARYTIRAAAMQVRSPADALEILNDAMLRQAADGGPDLFATVALARMRRRGDRLEVTVTCGGHPTPLIRRAGGQVEEFGTCGTVMGVLDNVDVHDAHTVLTPGDTLVLVTDGVLEARRDGEMFGEDGLRRLLAAQADGQLPAATASAIAKAAITHQGGDIADDIAVVALSPSPPT
ncbi:MAG TPA: SpoIIE family protein phosphatase [Acidimicrobiales bacterium]|nr:SpoIIE family protein phosphatase [Acidimicrobiales bacterium]